MVKSRRLATVTTQVQAARTVRGSERTVDKPTYRRLRTYTFDPSTGYVVNHHGTNGIVMRTEWSWPQLAFRDDIFVAISASNALLTPNRLTSVGKY